MVEAKTTFALTIVLLAVTGVEPQPLFWAMVGAVVGLATAPTTGRARAIVVFIAVVLLSALAGTFLANVGFSIAPPFVPLARNAFSALIAMIFHPLTTAFVNALPLLLERILSRLGSKP